MVDMRRLLARILILHVFLVLVGCESYGQPVEMAVVSPATDPDPQDGASAERKELAFPGAEGFGSRSVGGRGGRVIEVTNLDDSGVGSLRACVETPGPRTCVFRTGGLVQLQAPLQITEPYITIAGQTAPGGGITVKHVSGGETILVFTHDVIVRYLTVRAGPGGQNNSILISNPADEPDTVYNVIVDHCSLSWATDEVITTWYDAQDVTIQWSIISEGLDCSTHPKGCHSKGAMMGGPETKDGSGLGASNISFHHNLLAHNAERAPWVDVCGVVDIVNNVSYNPKWTFSHVVSTCKVVTSVNYVANYFKRGPDSIPSEYEISTVDKGGAGVAVFVKGNIGPHRPSNLTPEYLVVEPGSRAHLASDAAPAPSITTMKASEAYLLVMADAGATIGLDGEGNQYWRRDAVDKRIVSDVRSGTGSIINDPSEVGGWPDVAAGMPPKDSDHDGMPDQWEEMHGLDPYNPSDGPVDADGDGYTNLEEYLNSSDPADLKVTQGSSRNRAFVLPILETLFPEGTAQGLTHTLICTHLQCLPSGPVMWQQPASWLPALGRRVAQIGWSLNCE